MNHIHAHLRAKPDQMAEFEGRENPGDAIVTPPLKIWDF